ncbi:MAG: GIY-YIG nuclease family protein [Planctomycetes bacterium]|nr:GIY-YIG nuclease family protein [Planctomycetota bacterium]
MGRTCRPPSEVLLPFHTYILRCSDGSFYVGHCGDLKDRLAEHSRGEGAKHTRDRLPVELVYSEQFETQADAINRERQLKRWSRAKKEALISGDLAALKRAAKRRN